MKYYAIRGTSDRKILGHYPQVKNIIYNCDVWDNPLFIGQFHYEKINIIPIVANPVLFSKSKLTDLINTMSAIGFSSKELISGKLKSILENYITQVQFFQCSIFKDEAEHSDYWLLNIYKFNHEYIDFENSIIYYEKNYRNPYTQEFSHSEKGELQVKNLQEFMMYIEQAKTTIDSPIDLIEIKKLALKQNIQDDFFALKYGSGDTYFISEKLKKEIEDAGCTGLEFKPAELSLTEWLHGGEREKIYGKA
ncbi:hypothetical protein QQY79_05415 [Flavobacterium tructae]|uniref:imm11 family protein n=1 Tax=Flavobacterium TaxID=237 RepID=UPI00201F4EDF|nr:MULTISPECIES: DUF1629 domain-containing protein [Flavobacterium]MDL2141949.1 hypothetical protein [Flavobacterium tructae]URC10757.1 hypothetical protein M4I44_11710 [Flavobacterium sp. B183]